MKTHAIIILTVLSLFPESRLSAQPSVYRMPFENSYRLPLMESGVNMEEISATYQTLGNIYTTEISGFGDETMEQTSSTLISDVKAVDAVRFLEYYMEHQLLDHHGPSSGSVEMSVVYFNEDTRWNLGIILGVATFGVATMLGVPHSTAVVDVEVEATFFDDNRMIYSSHRGVGRGKSQQTLYSRSGFRKAHQRALRDALRDLNDKIMLDPVVTRDLQEDTP